MKLKLGKSIEVGQKIKTNHGWRKILKVNKDGATVKEELIKFGQEIYGWKL